MTIKHQADCYRTFDRVRWPNYCDIFEDEHLNAIAAAKAGGARIKIRKHPDGYSQAFIHPGDLNEIGADKDA